MKTLISLALAGVMLAALPLNNAFAGGRGGNGGTGIGIGVGNASSSSSSNAASYSRSNTKFDNRYQAPGIAAPGLAATGACPVGSVSFGASGPGAGLSFGWSKGDYECRAAFMSQLLRNYGYRQQSIQILANEVPMVAKVLQAPAQATPARGRPVAATASNVDSRCPSGAWAQGVVGGRCLY